LPGRYCQNFQTNRQNFETDLASGLSYSLASSHADVEEFISQKWRPSEVSAGRVDLTKDFLPDCGGTKVLAESTSPKVLVWLHDGSDATRIGFAGESIPTLSSRNRRI
jgi:hypothetical protein